MDAYSRVAMLVASCLALSLLLITHEGSRARASRRVALEGVMEGRAARAKGAGWVSMEGGTVHTVVKRAHRRAISLADASTGSGKSREQQLASVSKPVVKLSRTEEARCVGLLHSCQTWLELQDGKENHIVITSPDDDAKQLVDKNITLPTPGSHIDNLSWQVLQDSCRYGLADLRKCDKPSHWPHCTGADCSKK